MRILLVGTCLGVGGAEKVIVDLADSYQRLGHTTAIVALTGVPAMRPKERGVAVHALGFRTGLGAVIGSFRLARVIANFRPDVVHAHLFHAIILTRLMRLLVKIPRLITTSHSTKVEGWHRKAMYRLTDRLSDLSTSVSKEAVQELVRMKAARTGKIRVMYNGIAVEHFRRRPGARRGLARELGLNPSGNWIVAVGRLSPPKDYPNLLDALAILKKEGCEFSALIAGEGPLRGVLEARILALGLQGQVRLLGLRTDVRELLSASDVFALPSAWEGFPMVVGEAMACECVVVATDCGGVNEFVGDAGFVVPARDPAALALRLREALGLSESDRARIGTAARTRVQANFSLSATVDAWLKVYGFAP